MRNDDDVEFYLDRERAAIAMSRAAAGLPSAASISPWRNAMPIWRAIPRYARNNPEQRATTR